MTDRVAIFIDAGYLEHVFRPTASVDYEKLPGVLAAGDPILRSYYYDCPPFQSRTPTDDERRRKANKDRFLARLGQFPRFQVRLGRLARRSCKDCSSVHYQQKRVDILLGVDLVRLAAKQQIAKAILVAGDSDFLPAVELAKDEGVLVHLYHGGRSNPAHRDLLEMCDERTEMDSDFIDRTKR